MNKLTNELMKKRANYSTEGHTEAWYMQTRRVWERRAVDGAPIQIVRCLSSTGVFAKHSKTSRDSYTSADNISLRRNGN